MVAIKAVHQSNELLKLSPNASGLVAVFAGATSGIGMGTFKAFAKYAIAPKAYILGRSKKAAKPLLDELEALNPEGDFEFIEKEISLIKNVDEACDYIKSQVKKVDIVFLSPGYLAVGGREESIEGIDIPHALRYYSRLRFAYNLIPLLKEAPVPRVISILAGGKEKPLDLDDLEVKNDFTFLKAASNGTGQTTLAFEELANAYPSISFIHKYPGFVNTGVIERLLGTIPGILSIPATIVGWAVLPIVNLFSYTVEEAGERGLFIATSARYPPAKPKTVYLGVELPQGVHVAEASVVKDGNGNGMYRLGGADDSAAEAPVMVEYRANKVGEKVWEETQAVWDRALQRSA